MIHIIMKKRYCMMIDIIMTKDLFMMIDIITKHVMMIEITIKKVLYDDRYHHQKELCYDDT